MVSPIDIIKFDQNIPLPFIKSVFYPPGQASRYPPGHSLAVIHRGCMLIKRKSPLETCTRVPLKRGPPLIRTHYAAPRMSRIEGFHCIMIVYNLLTFLWFCRLPMRVCVQMVVVIWHVECASVNQDSLVQSVSAQKGELVCKFTIDMYNRGSLLHSINWLLAVQ